MGVEMITIENIIEQTICKVIDEKLDHFYNKIENLFNEKINQSHFNELGELLTDDELCKIFRVQNGTLRRWRNEGILPTIQVGKRYFYKQKDIESMIN